MVVNIIQHDKSQITKAEEHVGNFVEKLIFPLIKRDIRVITPKAANMSQSKKIGGPTYIKPQRLGVKPC